MRIERWFYTIPLRLRSLFRRQQAEEELSEELQYHIEQKTEQYIAQGMDAEQARRAALRDMDGPERHKEECRDMRHVRWIEDLLKDLRFGLRQLRRNPGFTAVAIITLALGIGATTAIFSVMDDVLLAPLPYPHSARLVGIWETLPRSRHAATISYPNFRDWQRNARSFERMAAFGWSDYEFTSPGTPEHIWGMEVSTGFFTTLGARLALGREFTRQEDQPGGARVAIISYRMWKSRFGGSPDTIGRTVTLNGIDRPIVGVAPPQFNPYGQTAYRPDIYTPLGQRSPAYLNPRGSHSGLLSIARLKPGISITQAQAEMSTIQHHLDELYPNSDRGLGAKVISLKEQIVGRVTRTLLLIFGAVVLVLLIACSNAANLLLVRSAARTREFAVRAALGAGRARVVRQLLTESLMLAIAGGGLGLLIATRGVRPVLAVVPGGVPRNPDSHLNAAVLLFALGIAAGAGILFGLAPALYSSKCDLQKTLKEGSRTSSRSQRRTQNSLVIFQVALTAVLLVSAGLLLRTIRHLWDKYPGFDARHIITFNIGLSPSAARTGAGTRHAYQQLVARVRHIPGVEAAGLTYVLPLTGDDNITPFWIGSQRPAAPQAAPRMRVFDTGPDYLRVMKIPLLRGRFFTQQDNLRSPCVAAIDNVFAQEYFPGKDPLGQTITFGWTPPIGPCRIVGVVGHVRHSGLNAPGANTQEQSYFPLYQVPNGYWSEGQLGGMAIVVRTPLDPAVVMPEIRNAAYAAGRQQTVYDVETMEQILSDSMWQQRFPMILLGIFACLALILAAIGIYGVISYSVGRRTHEIGIRMALGADKRDVLRMVIGNGLKLALAGVGIGIAAALDLTRFLASLLYGVKPTDPLTFVAVSLILIAVALLACYIPARRAAKVDPMVALRYE